MLIKPAGLRLCLVLVWLAILPTGAWATWSARSLLQAAQCADACIEVPCTDRLYRADTQVSTCCAASSSTCLSMACSSAGLGQLITTCSAWSERAIVGVQAYPVCSYTLIRVNTTQQVTEQYLCVTDPSCQDSSGSRACLGTVACKPGTSCSIAGLACLDTASNAEARVCSARREELVRAPVNPTATLKWVTNNTVLGSAQAVLQLQVSNPSRVPLAPGSQLQVTYGTSSLTWDLTGSRSVSISEALGPADLLGSLQEPGLKSATLVMTYRPAPPSGCQACPANLTTEVVTAVMDVVAPPMLEAVWRLDGSSAPVSAVQEGEPVALWATISNPLQFHLRALTVRLSPVHPDCADGGQASAILGTVLLNSNATQPAPWTSGSTTYACPFSTPGGTNYTVTAQLSYSLSTASNETLVATSAAPLLINSRTYQGGVSGKVTAAFSPGVVARGGEAELVFSYSLSAGAGSSLAGWSAAGIEVSMPGYSGPPITHWYSQTSRLTPVSAEGVPTGTLRVDTPGLYEATVTVTWRSSNTGLLHTASATTALRVMRARPVLQGPVWNTSSVKVGEAALMSWVVDDADGAASSCTFVVADGPYGDALARGAASISVTWPSPGPKSGRVECQVDTLLERYVWSNRSLITVLPADPDQTDPGSTTKPLVEILELEVVASPPYDYVYVVAGSYWVRLVYRVLPNSWQQGSSASAQWPQDLAGNLTWGDAVCAGPASNNLRLMPSEADDATGTEVRRCDQALSSRFLLFYGGDNITAWHQFFDPGNFTVTVSVRDGEGNSASDTALVIDPQVPREACSTPAQLLPLLIPASSGLTVFTVCWNTTKPLITLDLTSPGSQPLVLFITASPARFRRTWSVILQSIPAGLYTWCYTLRNDAGATTSSGCSAPGRNLVVYDPGARVSGNGTLQGLPPAALPGAGYSPTAGEAYRFATELSMTRQPGTDQVSYHGFFNLSAQVGAFRFTSTEVSLLVVAQTLQPTAGTYRTWVRGRGVRLDTGGGSNSSLAFEAVLIDSTTTDRLFMRVWDDTSNGTDSEMFRTDFKPSNTSLLQSPRFNFWSQGDATLVWPTSP